MIYSRITNMTHFDIAKKENYIEVSIYGHLMSDIAIHMIVNLKSFLDDNPGSKVVYNLSTFKGLTDSVKGILSIFYLRFSNIIGPQAIYGYSPENKIFFDDIARMSELNISFFNSEGELSSWLSQ